MQHMSQMQFKKGNERVAKKARKSKKINHQKRDNTQSVVICIGLQEVLQHNTDKKYLYGECLEKGRTSIFESQTVPEMFTIYVNTIPTQNQKSQQVKMDAGVSNHQSER